MIIFSPGPANITEKVRKSLLMPDICHRDSEFKSLLKEVRRLVCIICGVKSGYKSVVFTGSGTAAIEAVISSFKPMNKKMLIISNGLYGERAYDISCLYKIKVKKINFSCRTKPDLLKIESTLNAYRPEIIYVVHHETTTGLLNPLKEIGRLAKKYNAMLVVDGISSIGGEYLDIKEWGIDVLIGSANKCIRGITGLSFAVLSARFIKALKVLHINAYYLNLLQHFLKEENGETPFTPAVHSFYAFRQALRELLKETVAKRISHYRKTSFTLRQGLRKQGLQIYVDDDSASLTMSTVILPKGINYKWLHRKCKAKGYVIYKAIGELKDKAFRLGTVGCISQKDVKNFLKTLKSVISCKAGTQ